MKDMTPQEKLAACPFCGAEPELKTISEYQSYSARDAQSMGMGVSAGGFTSTSWAIECKCGIRIPGNNDDFLRARWNRRTSEHGGGGEAATMRVLAALGHEPKVSDRCTAHVVQPPPSERPPGGPRNPPVWCCLKAGHEGEHRCNDGGMSLSYPFRKSDKVEFREPVTLCVRCGTRWPCPDAQKALATTQSLVDGGPLDDTGVTREMAEAAQTAWERAVTEGLQMQLPAWSSLLPMRQAIAAALSGVSAPVGVEGFDAIRKALADLVRAGKRFRNTVVETRGVRGMDEHDLALSAAEAALAQQPAAAPRVEGNAYVSEQGSVTVDWDDDPQRQLSIMVKRDGSVAFSAFANGERFSGDAKSPEFWRALSALVATPAASDEGAQA